MSIIVIICILVFLAVVFLFMNGVAEVVKEANSCFYEATSYEAPPMPETKPCPDFKPPATKPKKVGDLEPNLCPNCGASFNPNTLHCEYCGTWFREKETKPTFCIGANGITVNGSNNCIRTYGRKDDVPLVHYEYEKNITINTEDVI